MDAKQKEESQASKKENKKNPLQKLKEGLDDTTTTLIKIVVLGWSGAILTLNYVSIPGIPQQKIDPTFIASVFTGVLASFNITTTSKKGEEKYKIDEETKNTEAAQYGAVQTIRVETPIKLVPVQPRIDPITNKPIDPQSGKLT
jgi:cytoskeletal protein RodZ